MIIALTILLGLLLGWREVQILIQRGSWHSYQFHNWFWGENWYPKWYKDFDSFHFINGLAVLVICAIYCAFDNFMFNILPFSQALNKIAQIIALWFWIMYWRNFSMHIILPLKGYKRWWYLVPILGSWFNHKVNK